MRLGTERCRDGDIDETLLFANRIVLSLFINGKLPNDTIALSVKSMASCWSYEQAFNTRKL